MNVSSTWPSLLKGMTIAYGHNGSGLYLPHVDAGEPWQFARVHGRGHRFHDISGFTVVSKAAKLQMDELMSLDRSVMHNEMRWMVSDSYFPSDLALGYSYESNNIVSGVGFDPTVGSLVDIGRLDSGNDDYRTAIAYVDGNVHSTMRISCMEDESIEISTDDQRQMGSLTVPQFKNTEYIDMDSPLKQIQFADPEPTVSPYLLCRTGLGTNLVRVDWSNKIRLNGKLTISNQSSPHVHSQFNSWDWNQVGIVRSNASYGIWQLSETDVVNSYQSQLPDHLLSRSKWHKLLFENSTTLLIGNRRGIFSIDSRSSSSYTSLIEISAEKTAYQLHDFVQSPLNNNHIFAMTTDHLTWIDSRMPSKSLLSWKHYLSPDDPSWRLSMSIVDHVTEISVHSQMIPARIIYQFIEENGLPKSADDPYYIGSPIEGVVQSMISRRLEWSEKVVNVEDKRHDEISTRTSNWNSQSDINKSRSDQISGFRNRESNQIPDVHDNDSIDRMSDDEQLDGLSDIDGKLSQPISDINNKIFMVTYFMSTDRALYRQILSTDNKCRLPIAKDEPESTANSDNEIYASESDDIYRYEKPSGIYQPATIYYYAFRSFYKYLFEDNHLPDLATTDDLQEYASQLSAEISQNFKITKYRAIRTLEEVKKPEKLFDDSNSLSDMINQLAEHYQDSKITVLSLNFELKTLFDENSIKNMSDLNNYFLSLWLDPIIKNQDIPKDLQAKRYYLCNYIATEMILACTGIHFTREKSKNKPEYLQTIQQYVDGELTGIPLGTGAKLLLDEWNDTSSVNEYEWHKLGDSKPLIEERYPVDPFARLSQNVPITQKSQSSQIRKKKKRKEGFV